MATYKYAPGTYKIDWALSEPIPWTASGCARAATVHLGGTFAEIVAAESAPSKNETSTKPFVLLVQPSLFDFSRAPAGRHTAWAYCHVPNGSTVDMTSAIEAQVERFAPGFRDCILARRVMASAALEAWNPNLIGGDLSGGAMTPWQLLMRPTPSLYNTAVPNLFLCSSSTPPGGGVHGMCGHHAAQRALSLFR
jgi:phytoene dehydrogenase-like protein